MGCGLEKLPSTASYEQNLHKQLPLIIHQLLPLFYKVTFHDDMCDYCEKMSQKLTATH